MSDAITYPPQNYQPPLQTGMSLKEKLGYGIVAALLLGTGIYVLDKQYKKVIAKKSDLKSFNDGSPQTVAKQIKMAFENDSLPGTDLTKLRYVMSSLKSKDQWAKVVAEYNNQFHSNLLQDMKKELQSSEYDEMLFIKESKPQKEGQAVAKDVLQKNWAKRLKAAFDKTYSFLPGTDETAIKAVFNEIPTQRDFAFVALYYQREYKAKLLDALKSELEYWEYPSYMTLILKKPKA